MNNTEVVARTIRDRAHHLAEELLRVLGNGVDPSDPSNRDPEFIESTVLPVFRILAAFENSGITAGGRTRGCAPALKT